MADDDDDDRGRGRGRGRDGGRDRGRDRRDGGDGGGGRGSPDKRAQSLFDNLLSESPLDSIVESAGDIVVRNKAEEFGGMVAESFIRIPAARVLLFAVPAGVLSVLTGLLVTRILSRHLRDLDRPVEWGREFAQGFSRRIQEMQSGTPRTPASTAPAAPAGPRQMTASEVLTKHPEIIAVIDRGLQSPDPAVQATAARVQADIHQHLNFAHEGETLASPSALPPPPFSTTLVGNGERQRVVAFVEEHGPVGERAAVIAELEKKVTGALQCTDLLAPMPAPVAPDVPPVSFTELGDRLEWLRNAYSDPDELEQTLLRLAPHARDAGRKAYLFAAPADAGLPGTVAMSPAWSAFTAHALWVADDEAAALIAAAETRVDSPAQVEALIAPPPGGAPLTADLLRQRILALPVRTPALMRPLFEQRLAALELLQRPATGGARRPTWADFRARLAALPDRTAPLTLEILQQRIALIRDDRQSRLAAPLHNAIARVSAVIGGPDQAVQAMNQTATALGNIRTRLFGGS